MASVFKDHLAVSLFIRHCHARVKLGLQNWHRPWLYWQASMRPPPQLWCMRVSSFRCCSLSKQGFWPSWDLAAWQHVQHLFHIPAHHLVLGLPNGVAVLHHHPNQRLVKHAKGAFLNRVEGVPYDAVYAMCFGCDIVYMVLERYLAVNLNA